jgi:hypothetical protein
VTYQPAGRYWTFQWLEMATYIAIGLILAGSCFARVRHRLA